jgi:hypothetical protein
MAVLEWRELVGKTWNKTAFLMITQAREIKIDNTILAKARAETVLTNEERIKLIRFNYAQYIAQHEFEIHAICEARERKRNAQLGLPPTVSEIQFIIEMPEQPEFSSDFLEDI